MVSNKTIWKKSIDKGIAPMFKILSINTDWVIQLSRDGPASSFAISNIKSVSVARRPKSETLKAGVSAPEAMMVSVTGIIVEIIFSPR